MKSLVRLALALALAAVLATGLFANGLNLNGFGARATAMGGAYVSLADDVTAVFWNPAGLTQLKKGTFGLAGDLLIPKSTYGFGPFSMQTTSKKYPAGLLGYFQPIGNNIVVGVGAYTLSGLGAEWDNPGLEAALLGAALPGGYVANPPLDAYKWRSFIGSVTLAPSIAFKLGEYVSLGASFNINYGFFKTDQWAEYNVIAVGPPTILFNLGQASMDIKGWGYGATVGLMVKPSDMISFGATYRLQSKLKLKGTTSIENLPLINPAFPDTSDAELDAISPMWLAGGVSVKPMDNLTLAFDLQWTNWKKLDVLTVRLLNETWNNFLKLTENTLDLQWTDQIQIRAGIEYVMGNFALRGGYYHDPAPAPDATLNILIPSFDYNSIAGGFGYKTGGLSLDFTLEYLMGKDRTVTAGAMPGNYAMNILVPVVGLSYSF
ncbi:MAG TPA: outer membrane protein transport protein [Acidobacteriota bacterium]|nr:outer membrane protein transport protein [Acidobacteriota bacterium]